MAVESPYGGAHAQQWTHETHLPSVILAKRGSPKEGQSSALSLYSRNQPWDSRAERENDSRFSASSPFPRQNQPWDSSVASGSL